MLATLLRRATGNLPLDRDKNFRPSMVYRLMNDPFGIWCDYHAPKEEAVEEINRYEGLRQQLGLEFEESWIRENYPQALKIEPEFGLEALKNTLRAMLDGVPAIQGPQLWHLSDEIYGRADLLIRSNQAPSDLGSYHYRVKEIKRSNNLQDHHSLQAGLYNRMLGHIQGYIPDEISVVLRNNQDTVPYSSLTSQLEDLFSEWRQIRDDKVKPEPTGMDKTDPPWRQYANRLLQERMDFTLLADVGPSTRAKLRQKLSVERIDQLYSLSMERLMAAFKPEQATSIYYHAQAYRTNKPVLAPGTYLEIPRGRRHLYFDFETSDEVHPTEPPHVYLIGLWDEDKEKYIYFLGRGVKEERKIFEDFLNYVGNPEGLRLYHWTDFEIGRMREVAGRHPGIADQLKNLEKFCVDLKEEIKQQVYLPVPTYSIKSVAPCLRFQWRQEDVDAFESMVLYWEFLKDGDEKKIQKVLDYNEDDCKAMVCVERRICQEFGLEPYIEPEKV